MSKNVYLSQLAKEKYAKYLQSEYWITFRESAFNNLDYQYCWHCGEDNLKLLLLHHLNYNLYYEELYTDVIPVCINCHRKIHKK